ncbi:MAG TPA: tRNA (adenosine(37)-N6)-threonylcarbamoyltransferase complex dimerization subunit type 1 TsaB [Aggregatilineales bacterium]|nr:tRNA (adenosine(37)-N6)-threonylcarbamoyltransferase complex dimerization subunit type 1 TsaB [Aggregatilineales bacterium]
MLLAIDTATRCLSLALYDGLLVRAEMTWTTANQHTVELMPAIREVLRRAQVEVDALTVLAVSQGPGSFNGLRIGFSVAKGLALARDLPLIPIPTLDVIAVAQARFEGTLLAVIQVGRGRICAGSYRWRADSKAEGWLGQDDLKIMNWPEALARITTPTLVAGELDDQGLSEINRAQAESIPLSLASPASRLRRAGFLAELAWQRRESVLPADAAFAAPLYLHQPGVPHP